MCCSVICFSFNNKLQMYFQMCIYTYFILVMYPLSAIQLPPIHQLFIHPSLSVYLVLLSKYNLQNVLTTFHHFYLCIFYLKYCHNLLTRIPASALSLPCRILQTQQSEQSFTMQVGSCHFSVQNPPNQLKSYSPPMASEGTPWSCSTHYLAPFL